MNIFFLCSYKQKLFGEFLLSSAVQVRQLCVCKANVLTSFVLLSLESFFSMLSVCLNWCLLWANCRQIFTEQLSCGENKQLLQSCSWPFAWLSHEAPVDARPQVSQPLSARFCLFFSFNYFIAFMPLSLPSPDTCRQSNGR